MAPKKKGTSLQTQKLVTEIDRLTTELAKEKERNNALTEQYERLFTAYRNLEALYNKLFTEFEVLATILTKDLLKLIPINMFYDRWIIGKSGRKGS